MKKSKMLIAVFAVLAAVSAVKAEEASIGFDGRQGPQINFGELLAGAGSCREAGAACTTPEPERVLPDSGKTVLKREIKINVIMKTKASSKTETVVCGTDKGGPLANACRKQGDAGRLTDADIVAMSMRKYFPAEKQDFSSLLGQAKHSYTNQSGPQTFSCSDTCGNYDWSVTISPYPPYLEEATWTCVEWTHECECVGGCY